MIDPLPANLRRRARPGPAALAIGVLALLPAAAGVGVVPVASARAQQEPAGDQPEPGEIFVDTLRVDVVDVDVYVTDKDGRPVTGLTVDDFEVFEDGRPVTVTNFYAVEDGKPAPVEPEPAAGAGEPAGPAAAPPPVTGTPPPELPKDQRLWVVVYVDDFNIRPLDRNRILPALRAFLYDTLRPGDRSMVVSYDRTIKVRQPFTADPVSLVAALDELEDVTGHLTARDRERADVLRLINDSDSPVQASMAAGNYAESVMHDLETTADALSEFIDSLAGLPGRKALVYVSSGLPMIAGEELFHLIEGKYPSSYALRDLPRYDLSNRFHRLAARASESRVAFYTLDAAGLRVHTLGTAEYPELTTLGMRMQLDSVVQESAVSGMRFIAQESGGEAIVNVNQPLAALDRIGDQLATFYSLGYPAATAGDGRFHRIEVKVKRRGVRVRHREGYRGKTAGDRMSESVRAALMHSYESNDLGVRVVVGHEEPQGRGLYRVPVQVEIPLQGVVFLPRPDGRHEARMRLFIGAVDDHGRFSEVEQVPLGLRVADEDVEAVRGEALLHPHRLLMRSGRQRIAFGVYDELGAGSALVFRQLRIGS